MSETIIEAEILVKMINKIHDDLMIKAKLYIHLMLQNQISLKEFRFWNREINNRIVKLTKAIRILNLTENATGKQIEKALYDLHFLYLTTLKFQ